MVMSDNNEFSKEEIANAFMAATGRCECCGKKLSWENGRANPPVWGQWEAHRGNRPTPVILCADEPEHCHLFCGHDGDFDNPGVTPCAHKGGWFKYRIKEKLTVGG
jgi:hypothetical protein